MMKSLTLGALLGGLVVFAWSAVSWMVLTWHNPTMNSFANEAAVAQVLMENAPTGGMYWLPGMPAGYDKMKGDEKKAADAAMEERMKTLPFFYGVVQPRANFDMGRQMGASILFDILAALLITGLVMKTGGMSYLGRVMFIVTVALAAGVIAVVPNWVWWHFGTGWTVVGLADIVIAWFLSGLVIAKVGAPKAA
jgi:hypothetical protein